MFNSVELGKVGTGVSWMTADLFLGTGEEFLAVKRQGGREVSVCK